jgi:hypothetical protein
MVYAKNWCFTVNNFLPSDEDLLKAMPTSYLLYGKETCPTTGTPHLQGYAQFRIRVRLTGLKKLHSTAHWEVAKGSSADNYTYCTKDDKDFFEQGSLTNTAGAASVGVNTVQARAFRNQRLMTVPFRELVASGELHPGQVLSLKNGIAAIKEQENRLNPPERLDGVTRNLWYWGESGTGKSMKAQDDYPKAYHKNANKWWCGYDGEDDVIMEDFDKRHEKLVYHLKLWSDRYPFNAEVKGGSTGKIRPKRIVVTSNYHPSDIWTEDSDLAPILRRFTFVKFPL